MGRLCFFLPHFLFAATNIGIFFSGLATFVLLKTCFSRLLRRAFLLTHYLGGVILGLLPYVLQDCLERELFTWRSWNNSWIYSVAMIWSEQIWDSKYRILLFWTCACRPSISSGHLAISLPSWSMWFVISIYIAAIPCLCGWAGCNQSIALFLSATLHFCSHK